MCVGILVFALVWTFARQLDATPSSSPESTLPVDLSGQWSTPATSGTPQSPFAGAGAPDVLGGVSGGSGASPPDVASGDAAPSSGRPEAAVTPSGETPSPSSDVGTAIWTASATWCAPRGDQCTRWGGDALLAALPTFRYGDTPYLVRVTRGSASVVVAVVSQCWCGIDLSPYSWEVLGVPLSRGRITVTVEGPVQ